MLNSTAGNPIAREFWKKGQADRGRQLYHGGGCVACHQPDGNGQAASGFPPLPGSEWVQAEGPNRIIRSIDILPTFLDDEEL